jgi:antitoxin (DNA-binding transcriptional repressor) of toxin-antitoxin stability system
MNYSVAGARQHLAKALDEAERGKSVAIVRRGVRFRLVVEPSRKPAASTPVLLEVLDAALLESDWQWDMNSNGDLVLQLAGSKKRKTAAATSAAKARRLARQQAKT